MKYCAVVAIACCPRKTNYTHTHNRLTAFGPGLADTKRNIHPLTPILIIGHPLSSSSIYNDQWHPLCSFYVLDSPFIQPLQVLFGLPLGLGLIYY